jgi:hypothetical protein
MNVTRLTMAEIALVAYPTLTRTQLLEDVVG